MLILLLARISRPPPNAKANPFSPFFKRAKVGGPGVLNCALVCAAPPRTWTNGVKRVLLRAFNSGPARKLYTLVLRWRSCVEVVQVGLQKVIKPRLLLLLKWAEKSAFRPR